MKVRIFKKSSPLEKYWHPRTQHASKRHRRVLLVTSLIFLLLSPLALLFLNKPEEVAAWYSSQWRFRKKFAVDNTKVSGSTDLTNFPILVSITDTDLAIDAQNDGDDILFTDVSSTKLDHEIEKFDDKTGELVAWVEIPTLYATSDTIFYMYYGNNDAASQQNATGVWDSNFKGIWHSHDTSGTTLTDSTTALNGTKESSTAPNPTTSGKFDGAQDYSGSDYVDLSTSSSLNPTTALTIEGWIYIEGGSGTYRTMFGRWDTVQLVNERTYTIGLNSSNQFYFQTSQDGRDETAVTSVDATTPDSNTWYYYAATWDGSVMRLYRNGSQVDYDNQASIETSPNTRTSIGAIIGRSGDPESNNWNGLIDEVRFSNTNRSADWIATSYNTMSSPSTFYSTGPEERETSPVLYWKFDEGADNTCSGGTNDACDSSGSSNDGAKTNATWKTGDVCMIGNCLSFDGSGDYVSRSYSSDVELNPEDGDFSISAWFKHASTAPSTNTPDVLIARYNGAGYKLYMNDSGYMCFGIDDDSTWTWPTTIDDTTCSTTSYADSKWHFIEGVKNGTTSITLYIDGVQVAQDATLAANTSLSGTTPTFYVGIDSDATNYSWDGFIDEVKYTAVERSAANVKADYTARSSEKGAGAVLGGNPFETLSSGLVGYWKMDESAANSCTGGVNDSCDSSGNDFDGAWNGNATNTTGKFGNGVTFDGTGDYVNAGDIY